MSRKLVTSISALFILLFVGVGVGVGGCGSGSGSPELDASANTLQDTAAGDIPGGPFDLQVEVQTLLASGAPWKARLYLALRDAASGELVAFEHQPQLTGKLAVSLPGKLLRGRSYTIGVTPSYASCLTASTPVIYKEIPSVDRDVALKLTLTKDKGHDPRGCDVLHVPVKLPAGTYSHTPGLFGGGQSISLVVSPTGRIYLWGLFVLCANPPSNCYPSLIGGGGGPGCGTYTRTPIPGVSAITLEKSGSKSQLKVTVTIDESGQRFIVKGFTETYSDWFATLCCHQTIDTTLTRRSSETNGCI
jgi:hypothetical protein